MNKKFIFCIFVFGILLAATFVSAGLFSKNRITANVVSEGWTEWKDRDGPGGTGDWELKNSFSDVCENPSAIECQTTDGVDYTETEQIVTCDTSTGFFCRNRDNTKKCLDYIVRFYCGSETGVSGGGSSDGVASEFSICQVNKTGITECNFGGIPYQISRPWGDCQVLVAIYYSNTGYEQGFDFSMGGTYVLYSGVILENMGTACTDNILNLKLMQDVDAGSSCVGDECLLYENDTVVFKDHTIIIETIDSSSVKLKVNLQNSDSLSEGQVARVDLDRTTREIDGNTTVEILDIDSPPHLSTSEEAVKYNVRFKLRTAEDVAPAIGVSVTSPDGTAWVCRVSNSGVWSCTKA